MPVLQTSWMFCPTTAVTREGLASSRVALKWKEIFIGTSAALLSSRSSNATLGKSQPQGKAGLAAHKALSRSPGNMWGPLSYMAKAAQQTDTDPVQTHLDLALCTPHLQGDTVWILTHAPYLKSLS